MGGRSSSSSASTTTNQDNRVAVQDGIGLSNSSGNAINITTVDGQIVGRALDTVDLNNATLGEGFESLLSAADNLFNRGENLIGQTQKAVADAYGQAQINAAGTIDNRTIIVLAVAAGAAVIALSRSK